ncbi:MAG TPA: hypothetical protein ENN69_04460, partial [Spirochaetia bacterium]|nr:hypothetical protein [Spirochaetia bacterium]
MKQMLFKIGLVVLAAGSLFMGACDGIVDQGLVQDVDSTFRSMSDFAQPEPMRAPQVVGPIEEGDPAYPDRPPDFEGLETQAFWVSDAQEFEELLCMDVNSDVLWLGSILDGGSVTSGEYRPITAPRGPLTISPTAWLDCEPQTVPVASRSSVWAAERNIVSADLLAGLPNEMFYTESMVYSEEQLKVALGANFRFLWFKTNAGFNFSDHTIRTRMLFKYQQVYYALGIDLPHTPADLFAPNVTWSDFEYQISSDVSPVIISSIKFGRMALFTIESEYSESEVSAAFRAAANLGILEGSVSLDSHYQEVINSCTIKVFVIGGDSMPVTGVE